MAMNSPDPQSWQKLTVAARQASPPPALDVRFAVRRQIESTPRPVTVNHGVIEELAGLFQAGWLRLALTLLLLGSGYSCWHGFDAAREIVWMCELRDDMLVGQLPF